MEEKEEKKKKEKITYLSFLRQQGQRPNCAERKTKQIYVWRIRTLKWDKYAPSRIGA